MAKKDAFMHNCESPPTLDFVYVVIPGDTRMAKFRRAFLRAITIHANNLHARRVFQSTAAIERERIRHMKKGNRVIHPFSKFRSAWNIFMIFVYLFSFLVTPIYVGFICTSLEKNWAWRACDFTQCVLCLVDIIVNFFTGYYTNGTHVEIRTWNVVIHYLCRYFIFDLLSSVPIGSFLCLILKSCPYCNLFPLMRLAKFVRIGTLYQYFSYVTETLHVPFMIQEGIWTLVAAFYIVHFLNSIVYIASYLLVEYDPETWLILELLMPNDSILNKYVCTSVRTTEVLFNMGYGAIAPVSSADQILNLIIAITGAVLIIIAIGRLLQWAYILYTSSALYDSMLQQLKSFMRYKQLPGTLQKRLIDYYEFRYQENFFKDAEIINTLSIELRKEISVYSCWQLVKNVFFLHNLPIALLTRLVLCLYSEFYLANDVIIKAGTVGDSMYFIAAGTVAIYSTTGFEVCHLEDGAHFGEVALVNPSSRRVASVVAVESCELYRLQGSDFKNAIIPYPDLKARIERIAEERFERTTQLDERNRRVRQVRSDKR